MNFVERPDFDALCSALATRIARVIRAGLSERGSAAVALAGGSTPFPLYRRLAEEPLDWTRVTILPSDERWVAQDHEACNLRAIRAAFADAHPNFGTLVPDEPGAAPSLDSARATLSDIGRPLDVCVLGMGADGHFASLFPGTPELQTALDPDDANPVVIVHPDPMPEDAPFPRVSLTLSAIAASDYVVLLIRGERKRQVLASARNADPRRYPVAALLAQPELPLEIHWSP